MFLKKHLKNMNQCHFQIFLILAVSSLIALKIFVKKKATKCTITCKGADSFGFFTQGIYLREGQRKESRLKIPSSQYSIGQLFMKDVSLTYMQILISPLTFVWIHNRRFMYKKILLVLKCYSTIIPTLL